MCTSIDPYEVQEGEQLSKKLLSDRGVGKHFILYFSNGKS